MIRPVHSSLRFVSSAALALSGLTLSSTVYAQEDPAAGPAEEAPADDDFADMDEEGDDVALEEEMGEEGAEEEPAPEEETSKLDHKREPDGSTQLLLGARYRMMVTPKWLINMFGVDGGRSVVLHGFGPEIGGYFGETSDGFMVLFSPWFMGYGLDRTPFKGSKDDDSAWEVIESDMKVWYLTIDAMWDHKIIDKLSVDVGIGAGLGIVTGQLLRNEAYVDGTDPDIPKDKDWPNLSLCAGPGEAEPGITNPGDQCPGDGNYDISRAGSSDRWPVYPWLNFQTGLRYQPVDEFVGRLDIGIGSSGIWFGLGADYSLFL